MNRSAELASLREELASAPTQETWEPVEGDMIVGTVDGVHEGENQYGVFPIITLLTDDNRAVEISCRPARLRAQVENLSLTAGDICGFRYDGLQPLSNGKSVHAYVVRRTGHVDAPIVEPDDGIDRLAEDDLAF